MLWKTPPISSRRVPCHYIQLHIPGGSYQSRNNHLILLTSVGEKSSNFMLDATPVPPERAPSSLLQQTCYSSSLTTPFSLSYSFSMLIASKALHSHVPPTLRRLTTTLHHCGLHVGGRRAEIRYCTACFQKLGHAALVPPPAVDGHFYGKRRNKELLKLNYTTYLVPSVVCIT